MSGRRNRTDYSRPKIDQFWAFENAPQKCTEEFLEGLWRARCKHDPIQDNYDEGGPSLSCEDIADALKLLSLIDPVFDSALSALKGHGLTTGGLVQRVREFRRNFDARPAVVLVLPLMHGWAIIPGMSIIQAARLTAAQHGVPGASFQAVVDDLRKAYALSQKESGA